MPKRGGSILGTLQNVELWPEFSKHSTQLHEFTNEEAFAFVKHATQQRDNDDAINKLIKELGAFPLALGHAVAYIVKSKIAVADYLKEIQSDRSYQLFERELKKGTNRHQLPLTKTWNRIFEKLKSITHALEWLHICAYLNPVQIPEQWLETWLSKEKNLRKGQLTEAKRNILNALRQFGLARFDTATNKFSLHRLIQELLQFSEVNKKTEYCQATIALVEELVKLFSDPPILLTEKYEWGVFALVQWLLLDSPHKKNFEDLRKNDGFVLALVCKNGLMLKCASHGLKRKPSIVLAAVQEDGMALEYASSKLKNDLKIVSTALRNCGFALKYASKELQKHRESVLKAVAVDSDAFKYASKELLSDRKFVLKIVKKAPFAFEFASKELRSEKDFVLKIMEEISLDTFAFASQELWNDKAFVLSALKLDKNATSEMMPFVSDDLCNDREVIIAALGQDSNALSYASAELRDDEEVVLEAVKRDGLQLELASQRLQNTHKVVLAAVNEWGEVLEYASAELRNDKEVVLAAVKQSGSALRYASEELRNDRDVVLAAVTQDGRVLEFASRVLQKDSELIALSRQKKVKDEKNE